MTRAAAGAAPIRRCRWSAAAAAAAGRVPPRAAEAADHGDVGCSAIHRAVRSRRVDGAAVRRLQLDAEIPDAVATA